ncbi:class A beta-lactamase [Novosphingobium sp.]|uniref:class A beta-lactamase n=1 Tax=Novosphingobium sp. TaxID=1874826 RepID=UPI0033421337
MFVGALGACVIPVRALAGPVPAGVGMLARLERQAGGRLGVMVRDTVTGHGFGRRQDERFAQCSTFKLSLAALVLAEIDAGRAHGDEVLAYSVLDVLPNSPVTEAAAGGPGLPILTLAAAAVERSDNLAANLLLARFGGPAGLTAFWRTLGDAVSRLDNTEPALNHVAPGAVHDTTTPAAMAATVGRLLTGPALSGAARAQLWGWMKACATGLDRLRAGLPAVENGAWQAGDKTGTYTDTGTIAHVNDVALLLAPAGDRHFRSPLAVAACYDPPGMPDAVRASDAAVLAAVARIVTDPAAWRMQHR